MSILGGRDWRHGETYHSLEKKASFRITVVRADPTVLCPDGGENRVGQHITWDRGAERTDLAVFLSLVQEKKRRTWMHTGPQVTAVKIRQSV